jgi:protein-S-isoprenylcysteine O-methyltransferase Ste14
MDNLARKSIVGICELGIALVALIFVPAGSATFWRGWLYLATFLGGAIATTIYFMKHDPHLIQGRLRGGPGAETQPEQKVIQAFAGILFFAALIIPALGYRFGWKQFRAAVSIFGNVLVVLSFLLFFLVFRENSYAASTIKVESGQPVISTGLYGILRHPMYSAAVILFLGTPLALGSAWGLLVVIPLLLVLVARLLAEERYLRANLPGYNGYCQNVRWRLVPFLW